MLVVRYVMLRRVTVSKPRASKIRWHRQERLPISPDEQLLAYRS